MFRNKQETEWYHELKEKLQQRGNDEHKLMHKQVQEDDEMGS